MARILIIDDDEQIVDMLSQTLEREGYDIATASDGDEGLDRFRENPADLIITDLIMPEKEGIEIIIELRATYPNIKIIAISGGARTAPEEYLALAKGLGAQHTFTKPVNRDELLSAIHELLN